MQWKTSMFDPGTYNFNYDGANRLTTAGYSGLGNYQSSYSYDLNGNILTLNRAGQIGSSINYAMIDELTYNYSGNQLLKVDDINDGTGGNHQDNGYSDNGSFENVEYAYDVNGNMIIDANKSLQVAQYNYLNLPQQLNVFSSGNNKINYLYSATGIKLRKQTKVNYTLQTTTDYINNFVYEDGSLKYILTPEGRVMAKPDGTFEYQYFLKDHLGNTRVTFTQTSEVIQEDSYYPFGMAQTGFAYQSGTSYKNKYLYNGKELQDDFPRCP